MTNDQYDDFDEDFKSKTQIKEEMLALQDLGKSIAELPKAIYKSFEVPENLDDAIQTLHRIKSWNAQKRQHQFIGRIMRELDEDEVTRLKQKFHDYELGRKQLNRAFQHLEQTRTDMINGDKQAISDFIESYAATDRQQLMQHIRAAQKEKQNNEQDKSGKPKQDQYFKKLFKLLKQSIQDSSEDDS